MVYAKEVYTAANCKQTEMSKIYRLTYDTSLGILKFSVGKIFKIAWDERIREEIIL